MASWSGQIIDGLIRTHLHPALKRLGFTRTWSTWNRDDGEFRDVIDVQSGGWNSPGKGDFTINLGVFVPSGETHAGPRSFSPSEPVVK